MKVLNIAMNLNRIGNWAVDDYQGKKKKLILFIDQTKSYLNSLDTSELPAVVKEPLLHLSSLLKEGKQNPKDAIFWAEKMMTWGNILTHRANLIK